MTSKCPICGNDFPEEKKFTQTEKKGKLVPTKLGTIVYKCGIDPYIAIWILESLKGTGDVNALIEGYQMYLKEAIIYGVANELFIEGSCDLPNAAYRKLPEYESEEYKKRKTEIDED